jgi:membrane protein DedA with SNARE-associated domain
VGGITDALTGAIGDAGVYAVFALMFVDAILPAASELVMVYAGALAAGAFPGHSVTLFGFTIESTGWAYVVMAMAGVLGYWLGSLAGWAIGRYGGHPLLERHGRWFHLTPEKLDRAERWFERHGNQAVFWSRMLPVVRSFISIPAGVAEMPLRPYSVYTFLGTLPWCFGLAGAGLALGASWETFHHNFRYADIALLALIGAGAAYAGLRWWRGRQRRKTESVTERAG